MILPCVRDVVPKYAPRSGVLVSTVFISVGCGIEDHYETGVCHLSMDSGHVIFIVERYKTEEEAVVGHKKWTSILSHKKLSPEIIAHIKGYDE